MKMHNVPKIGIDIGRVIIGPVIGGRADTSFLGSTMDKAIETPPSPNALESIETLVKYFDGNAWLVSKCGPNVQRKTKAWLKHWGFYEATGIPADHVRFCLERPQKAHHCKQLKLTHFVDDRLDVLEHLRGLVPNLYLFGEQPKLDVIPDWVIHVENWITALDAILSVLQVGPDFKRVQSS